jgi:uncharacterized protein YbjT (DUF2867 family)
MRVFVNGGTGYIGSRLIARLLARGHGVTAVARPASRHKLPPGCSVVLADALDGSSYQGRIAPSDAFVQLVGVAHPSPAKAKEFVAIDQRSGIEAVAAARQCGVAHFVYVSVAHPAPMMRAYIATRSACEAQIRESGLNATILRPWYVLGPGHRWPYILLPFYKFAELIPSKREAALRLGLVTVEQMVAALAWAVEHPAEGVRVMEVPAIRAVR